MEKNYTVRELLALLFNKIWLIIVLAILFGIGAFFTANFVMPSKFESYTTMYVKNNTVSGSDNVNLNDLNASKSLVNTYIAILKTNAVMEEVGRRLTASHDEAELAQVFPVTDGIISTNALKNCFSMSSVDSTEVMKITANTKSPQISADMCNILAEISPDFLIRIVGAGSVEIIDVASPDGNAVSPDVPKITIIGILLGIFLAVGIILLIDFFDDTVKTTESLTNKFRQSILGEVPDIPKEKQKNKHIEEARKLLTDSSMPFNAAESYRSIRTNILFSLGTSDKKIIAVSSPNPSEGKSTMAANIAVAFAQTESKVLLIDADMRKSVQHRTFHTQNTEGLSTLIAKLSAAEDSVQKNVLNCLDLLPSGPTPPNPSELLASEHFAQLLETFAQEYDYIIIDTPPVNIVSDAMGMKDSISGILLVLKYGQTTFADVANCLKQIELVQTNLLGFVLNEVHHHHSAYYQHKYKKYDYGYGYGQLPSASEEKHAD